MRAAIVSYNFVDGNRYPRSPCSTYLRRTPRMGGGAEKSISATHMGKTSFGNIVHLFSAPGVRRFGIWSKLCAMVSLVPGGSEVPTTGIKSYFLYATIIPSRAGMRETIQSRSVVIARVKRRMASVDFS